MKLIKSSVEILDPTGYTIDDIYKSIELAGRTCYLSYDKITNDSAKKFVDMIIKRGHLSVLEHGTVYLYISLPTKPWNRSIIEKYDKNPYSVVNTTYDEYDYHYYITTNYRVLYENNWLDDLKYLCTPTEFHEKRITTRFILPISISREFCRHRCMSLAEQSSRFCNFSLDKFDRGITFIIPYWSNLTEGSYVVEGVDWINKSNGKTFEKTNSVENLKDTMFLSSCYDSETGYLALMTMKCKPQEAREVLSLCTKTELVITGTINQWLGFFKLRCDKAAHPQAQELANSLKEEFIKRNYINE